VRGLAIAALMVMSVMPLGASAEESTGNRVFFRGGFAGATSDRSSELFTNVHGAAIPLGVGGNAGGSTGYYVGGGMDLMLSRDVWGLMKNIAILGEVGVEFKRFNSPKTANFGNVGVGGPTCTGLAVCVNSTTPSTAQITMLTVDIAPKVKFMQGTNFQPWIIPVGLDFHVISPPSNQGNYLDIGVQFGAGAEYRIWKELWLGVDGRFHLASNQTNIVNNYGTVGAYVGIGF
jgi:hypothetical protein